MYVHVICQKSIFRGPHRHCLFAWQFSYRFVKYRAECRWVINSFLIGRDAVTYNTMKNYKNCKCRPISLFVVVAFLSPPIALLTLLGFLLAVIHPFWLVLNANLFRTELAHLPSFCELLFPFMCSEINTLLLRCKEMCKEMSPGASFQHMSCPLSRPPYLE